jgi:hypothetical protein
MAIGISGSPINANGIRFKTRQKIFSWLQIICWCNTKGWFGQSKFAKLAIAASDFNILLCIVTGQDQQVNACANMCMSVFMMMKRHGDTWRMS